MSLIKLYHITNRTHLQLIALCLPSSHNHFYFILVLYELYDITTFYSCQHKFYKKFLKNFHLSGPLYKNPFFCYTNHIMPELKASWIYCFVIRHKNQLMAIWCTAKMRFTKMWKPMLNTFLIFEAHWSVSCTWAANWFYVLWQLNIFKTF